MFSVCDVLYCRLVAGGEVAIPGSSNPTQLVEVEADVHSAQVSNMSDHVISYHIILYHGRTYHMKRDLQILP